MRSHGFGLLFALPVAVLLTACGVQGVDVGRSADDQIGNGTFSVTYTNARIDPASKKFRVKGSAIKSEGGASDTQSVTLYTVKPNQGEGAESRTLSSVGDPSQDAVYCCDSCICDGCSVCGFDTYCCDSCTCWGCSFCGFY